jgi:hypothetical protein
MNVVLQVSGVASDGTDQVDDRQRLKVAQAGETSSHPALVLLFP